MVEISMDLIKKLREWSGAGIMDCKRALQENNGDMEAAMETLRKQRADIAARKSHRETRSGMIGAYTHVRDDGGVPSLGVMVEVNIETDFAARNGVFKDFVKKLCLHIAMADPRWLRTEDVPEDVLEKEREFIRESLGEVANKPKEVVDKIVEGKLRKFYEDNCLLKQEFALAQDKADRKPIEALLKDVIGQIGENITIRRFVRMDLGA